MFRFFKITMYLSWIFLAFIISSCSSHDAVHGQRFFWPPVGQSEPKIEYLNFYQSDFDVERGKVDRIEQFILGKKVPNALFKVPFDIASDGQGRVYVSDSQLRKVLVIDLSLYEVRELLTENKPPLRFPAGLSVGPDGIVYVADASKPGIAVFGRDEKFLRSFGEKELVRPLAVVFNQVNNRIYVADPGQHQIVVFSSDGEFITRFGKRGSAIGEFNYPIDIDTDAEGHLYVLDSLNARVQVFAADGHFLRSFGQRGMLAGSFQLAKALAVGPAGEVLVTDSRGNNVIVFDSSGRHLTTIGGKSSISSGGVSPGGFLLPAGIDVDNQGSIWVVDKMNALFHRFTFLTEDYLRQNPLDPNLFLPQQEAAK